MLDQLVLADHAVGVLSEVEKKIKDLRLDMDGALGALELAPTGIKRKIVESYQQFRPSVVLREMTGESKAKNRRI